MTRTPTRKRVGSTRPDTEASLDYNINHINQPNMPECGVESIDPVSPKAQQIRMKLKALQTSRAHWKEKQDYFAQERARIDLQHAREQQLAEMHERVLRAQLYALAPIGVLPLELLLDIFRLLIVDAKNEFERWALDADPHGILWLDHHYPLLWSSMLHVCHHWRTVALDTPALWTWIALSNHSSRFIHEHTRRALELSCEMSLTISHENHESSSGQSSVAPPVTIQLLSNGTAGAFLPRLASVTLAITEDNLKDREVLELLGSPMLENLDVRVAAPFASIANTLLEDMAKLSFTKLRSLNIDSRATSFTIAEALIRPTLTSLTLTLTQEWPHIHGCILEPFVQYLEKVPALRSLHLSGIGKGIWDLIQSIPPPTVSLPKLEVLTLEETPLRTFPPGRTSACLLRRIAFPSKTTVTIRPSIRLDRVDTEDDDQVRIFASYDDLLAIVDRIVSALSRDFSFHAKSLQCVSKAYVRLWTSTQDAVSLARGLWDAEPRLCFSIEGSYKDAHVVQALSEQVDFAGLASMCISSDFSSFVWQHALSAAIGLVELCVQGPAVPSFLEAFALPPAAMEVGSSRRPARSWLFPALKKLHLEAAELTPDQFTTLFDSLRQRHLVGLNLTVLRFCEIQGLVGTDTRYLEIEPTAIVRDDTVYRAQ